MVSDRNDWTAKALMASFSRRHAKAVFLDFSWLESSINSGLDLRCGGADLFSLDALVVRDLGRRGAVDVSFRFEALTALAEGKFISDYFPKVYSCRLRPSTSPDKYLIAADTEIRHAYFQDHDPKALRRLGEQKQMELF